MLRVGAVGVAAGVGGCFCVDFVDEGVELKVSGGGGWSEPPTEAVAAMVSGLRGWSLLRKRWLCWLYGQFLGLALSGAALCTVWHVSRFPFRK